MTDEVERATSDDVSMANVYLPLLAGFAMIVWLPTANTLYERIGTGAIIATVWILSAAATMVVEREIRQYIRLRDALLTTAYPTFPDKKGDQNNEETSEEGESDD